MGTFDCNLFEMLITEIFNFLIQFNSVFLFVLSKWDKNVFSSLIQDLSPAIKLHFKLGLRLSNGHSPANLANSSTRQKFAIFGEYLDSRK